MKTTVILRVGLPGAVLSGLTAWVFKATHDSSRTAISPERLLYGVDEYWNGEYPEFEPSALLTNLADPPSLRHHT